MERAADLMPVVMARLLRDGEVVFHGVGSALPMVAIALARRLHAPRLRYINIAGGIDPAPRRLPLSSTAPELVYGSPAVLSNEDFYDFCARGGVDVAFLGAAQIDAQGRCNSSVIGEYARPKVRLPGGGGGAMIQERARRVILHRTQHTPRQFVPKLDFVTAAGNVDRVVTPLCLFRRLDGRLTVESLHPGVTPETLRAATGFPLDLPDDPPVTPPPTEAELQTLREVDPDDVRASEFA